MNTIRRCVATVLTFISGTMVGGTAVHARPSPAGSAFTYQGQLKQSGNPVNATADFEFRLFDVESGGSPIGAMFPVNNVAVADGQFTVDLDFGSLAFNGDARWLDISVRSPAGSGVFTLLTPRQPIRPVPMAQFAMGGSGAFAGDFSGNFSGSGASLTNVSAGSISGVIPSSALSGTYSGAVNFSNAANSFSGNGSAMTSLNASGISSGTLNDSRLSAPLLSRLPSAVYLGNYHVDSIDPGGVPGALATSTPVGTLAFVSRVGGLQVIDISDLPDPVLRGTVAGVTGGVTANGGIVYVNTGSQLKIVDASSPDSPTLLSTTNTAFGEISNPAFSNNHVYVATDFPTLQIFDVSNPASPTLAGSLTTNGFFAAAVAVADGFAYLLEVNCCNEIINYRVINVSNPAAPVLVATIPGTTDEYYPDSIAAGGGFLYIANRDTNAVDVYNVSNPAAPALVTSLSFAAAPRRIIITPGFLYVLRDDSTISVFDNSTPSSPVLVGSGSPGPNAVGGFAITRGHSISTHIAPSLVEIHSLTGVRFNQVVHANVGVTFQDGSRQDTAFRPVYNGALIFFNPSNAFAGSFTGGGAGLTGLNATNISTGNLASARLPTGGAWSLSSSLNLDSNTLLIDSATDRVGVGTSAPTQKFEVVGANADAGSTGSAADGIARFRPSGSSVALDFGFLSSPAHAWLQARDADDYATNYNLALNPNGGNVGIGTAIPVNSHRVTISGEVGLSPVAGTAYMSGSNAGVYLGYPTASDSANFELWNANNGYLRFGTNSIERLRIDSAGNVGIGVMNPAVKLQVSGAISATSYSGSGASLTALNASNLGSGNVAAARMPAGGTWSISSNLNIGNGGNTLVVNSAVARVGVLRTPTANELEVNGSASKTTAGDWLANSDRRIKTDVRDLNDALDVIDRVRPVVFRYTPEYLAVHPSIEDVEYYNVIAQEFAEVFPDSVKDSGEKLPNGESILQVDVHPMFIQAVAAIQQLHGMMREKDIEMDRLRTANQTVSKRLDDLERLVKQLLNQEKKGQ